MHIYICRVPYIYTTRFRRLSVEKIESREDTDQEDDNLKATTKIKVTCCLNQIIMLIQRILNKETIRPRFFSLIRSFCQLANKDMANSNVSYYLSFTTTLLGRIQDDSKP